MAAQDSGAQIAIGETTIMKDGKIRYRCVPNRFDALGFEEPTMGAAIGFFISFVPPLINTDSKLQWCEVKDHGVRANISHGNENYLCAFNDEKFFKAIAERYFKGIPLEQVDKEVQWMREGFGRESFSA